MHWLRIVTLIGAVLGLIGLPLMFASILYRDPKVPYTWRPVPVWRQRSWYTPRGFRLRVLGETLWTIGIVLCLIVPAVAGWLD